MNCLLTDFEEQCPYSLKKQKLQTTTNSHMVTKLGKRHLFLFNVQKLKLFPLFLSFSLVKQMVCDKKGVIINRELLCYSCFYFKGLTYFLSLKLCLN